MIVNPFQKSYNGKIVLNFPGFCFQQGRIYAVIGTNGSGKSTFARILSGTLAADHGRQPYQTPSPRTGYLPQKPYAFHMTLLKNLMLNADSRSPESRQRADKLIQQLNLKPLAKSNAATLSGGETSRMALARVMMRDYSFLILDEPTAALDIQSTYLAENLILDYCRSKNAAVLLITHSLKQAQRLSDQTLFFHEGNLTEQGITRDLLSHPQTSQLQEFLDIL